MGYGIDLHMWALNIMFLLGLLFVLAVSAVVLYILIGYVRARLWHARMERAERAEYERTHHPDGRPLPPTGRGFCDNCAASFEKVYFLESGTRLCPACYRKLLETSPEQKEDPHERHTHSAHQAL